MYDQKRRRARLALAAAGIALLAGCSPAGDAAGREAADAAATEPALIQDTNAELPPYVYPGSEPYIAEICAWMVSGDKPYPQSAVTIPSPIILEVDDSDPQDILIWGNFWTDCFTLCNTTLISQGGGEAPGLLHLKTEENGCSVTSIDLLGDGEDPARIFDMRRGLLHQFYNNMENRDAVRLRFISDYVAANKLPITQYQDFGWAPVPLLNAPATKEADQIVDLTSPLGYQIEYDLREFSSSYDDETDCLSGVDPLTGISIMATRHAEEDDAAALEDDMEQPQREETELGAEGVRALRIWDEAATAGVIKDHYVISLEDGGCLILSVRNTYFATPGDPVVPGADAVLEKTLQSFRLL